MESKHVPRENNLPPPYTPSTAPDTVNTKNFDNEKLIPDELPPPYSSLSSPIPDGQGESQALVVHQPQQPRQNVVVVVCPVSLGRVSVSMICPACRMSIQTMTETKAGNGTWTCAVVMCCCIGWPCALIPFCTDSCLDTVHMCPNCHVVVGKHPYEPC